MNDLKKPWLRVVGMRSLLTASACVASLSITDTNALAQAAPAVPAPTVAAEPAPLPVAAPPAPVVAPEPVVVAPPPAAVVAAPPAPPPAAVVLPAPAPAAPAAPPAAAAPAWTPVFTGSYFTRYEMRANYDDMGVSRARFLEGDALFYRMRFGIGTGLIDLGSKLKVGLQFTPQASGVFGNLANTTTDATLGLHEAYARVQGSYMRLDAGRFELNYGDALVIGNLDWNETGRTFDGARARVSSSPTSAWLDLFVTMVDEGTRDPAPVSGLKPKSLGVGDGDVYFYGLYAALGPTLMTGLDLDLYALGQGFHSQNNLKVTPADPMTTDYNRESAHQATFGVRAKQKIKLIDYRVEAGLQAGSRPGAVPVAVMAPMMPAKEQKSIDVMAYHIDAELGLNLASDKLRVGVEGIYASGDDAKTTDKNEGWDELYPTGHKFLGLADVFNVRNVVKRTNVTSGVLHLTVKPTKDLSVQADGHLFMRPEKIGTEKGRQGAEIDLGVAYTLAKGLKVRALYAVFLADKDFYPVSTPAAPLKGEADPIHYTELELRYDM